MKIYVGNLSYDVTEEELRQEFLAFGEVEWSEPLRLDTLG